MKIKPFFKKVLNLIANILNTAIEMIIFIIAAIAVYQGNYFGALLIVLYGIAMEIKKGFHKNLEISKDEIAFSILKQIKKEIVALQKKAEQNEKN